MLDTKDDAGLGKLPTVYAVVSRIRARTRAQKHDVLRLDVFPGNHVRLFCPVCLLKAWIEHHPTSDVYRAPAWVLDDQLDCDCPGDIP